ncbi:MAG TPA: hypothetical protein VGS96_04370 [Thermoanaerobaculia bacterium]|jgi:hypothetical protein|nr:hypothetical protein [Thermoanaerobaculia bacterium]
MKKLRWIVVVLVVLALLGGAYRIVAERNSAFFSPGQTATSMPMH